MSGELEARAAKIELIALDVDGVLTDGGLYYGPQGEAFKRFDVKDGHALVMARLVGLRGAIVTARSSELVAARARELGLAAVVQGRRDKSQGLREVLEMLEVAPEACAYMGDDVNDLGPFSIVGLSACPADAVPEARSSARFISPAPGGRGAVRSLIELCLKASGRWERAISLCR
jgi:3-deoxy-D-manno-octulosonate 8-phosphate phosphatase (KDO 8-P phosphatase)